MNYLDVPITLLLVEDDEAQLRLFAHLLLRSFGTDINLLQAADSETASAIIESRHVDVLLTDLALPGHDGLTLLRQIKQRNRSAQAILMTAYSTSNALLEALDTGAVDYVLKPVDHGLLLRLVRQAQQRIARWREALAGTFELMRGEEGPKREVGV